MKKKLLALLLTVGLIATTVAPALADEIIVDDGFDIVEAVDDESIVESITDTAESFLDEEEALIFEDDEAVLPDYDEYPEEDILIEDAQDFDETEEVFDLPDVEFSEEELVCEGEGDSGLEELFFHPDGYPYDSFIHIKVDYGSPVTLKTVIQDPTGITYSWSKDDTDLEEATGTLILSSATKTAYYTCTATDLNSNTHTVDFCVDINNNFAVTTNYPDASDPSTPYADVYVDAGESITLEVFADAQNKEGITYKWYKDDEPLTNSDSSLTVNVDKNALYVCSVTDCYGNNINATFALHINHLQCTWAFHVLSPVGEDFQLEPEIKIKDNGSGTIYVYPRSGQTILLEPTVTADDMTGIQYLWRESYDIGEIGTPERTLQVTASGMELRRFEATDKYGDSINTDFYIIFGHEHTYDENDPWHTFVIKEPTSSEPGIKRYLCTGCEGVYIDKEIPPLGTCDHAWDSGNVTKKTTCSTPGVKTFTCSKCKATRTEEIPVDSNAHTWDEGKVTKEPTAISEGEKTYTCKNNAAHKKIEKIAKLPATLKLNVSGTVPLKTKQTSKKVLVSDLAAGDSVASVKADKESVVNATVSGNTISLKGGKKPGSATVTVTLKSGKTASFKVKVQKATVKTKKISGLKKNYTLKAKSSMTLTPIITPITTTDKLTFTSSDKKVVTVSKKGKVTAKKKGKAIITVKSGKKKFKVKVNVTK